MPWPPSPRPRRDGVALVIILAFVVIITGVILAFFSRALSRRQVSNASASQTKGDQLAEAAADSIIGDLQQEIVMSSSAPAVTSGSATIYLPLTNASMLPQISGTTSTVPGVPPNLLKRSAYDYAHNVSLPFYSGTNVSASTTGTIAGGTINVSSTTPSLNGRTVSLARWNSHYLLPLLSGSDSTPVTPATAIGTGPGTTGADSFVPPDWVLITRSGSSPTIFGQSLLTSATNSTSVIGRYAYAIYHEGGLLDANVAGYPMGNSTPTASGTSQFAYKPALAYADLTQVGLTQTQVDELVAWRNYASTQAPGTSFQNPGFTQASGSNYYNFVLSNPSGFLSVSSTGLNNAGSMSTTSGQSDRMFGSRQELIAFMERGLGLSGTGLNVLNYLATFTRGLNQPSVAPPSSRPTIQWNQASGGNNAYGLDNQINPVFLTARVSGTFTRNDGSAAAVGEPLVKKRFALSKLAWITYLGPSANRVIPTSNPGVTNVNYDMWQLVNTYGISPSYLAQGTAANIQKYFGLVWQVDTVPTAKQVANGASYSFHDGEYKWFYTNHCETGQSTSGPSGSGISISATAGAISRLADIATVTGTAAREPDFFELLKAAVCAGSKAQPSMNPTSVLSVESNNYYHPYYYQSELDSNLDYAIIQLGANIIDQSKVDGYSTRIVLTATNGTAHEFRGVENLPYLYRVNSGTLKLRMESPAISTGTNGEEDTPPAAPLKDMGVGLIMAVPTLWNPHDENAPLGDPAPAGPGLPSVVSSSSNFRLIADSIAPDYLTSVSSPNTSAYTQFYGNGSENQVASTSGSAALALKTYTTGPNGSGVPIVPYIQNVTNPPTPAPANPLDPANASLNFVVPNTMLFREPTVLAMPNYPQGSQLQMGPTISEFTQIQNSAGQIAYSATGGFLSDGLNPLNVPTYPSFPSATQGYIGICAALYPIEWGGKALSTGTAGIYQSVNVALDYYNSGNAGGQYITYRLQYKDPNTNAQAYSGTATTDSAGWETYDEKYNYIDCLFLSTPFGSIYGNLADQADGTTGGDWESYLDPRTSRFAALNGVNDVGAGNKGNPVQTPAGTGLSPEWADSANAIGVTDRPDFNAGYAVTDDRYNSSGVLIAGQFVSLAAPGWTFGEPFFQLGLLSQNSPQVSDNGVRFSGDAGKNNPGAETPGTYYADPDNVVRGAMGSYNTAPSATAMTGLPLATAYTSSNNPLNNTTPPVISGPYQGQSRPYFLHRPFRSVAELGYVFSGTPWKNIDFFTPQSGDSALLDVFTANETPNEITNQNPLVAGVVNLNTQQAPVLQALLSNAYVDEAITSGTANTQFPQLSGTQAYQLLTSGTNTLINRIASTAAGQGPLQNVSDLVGRYYPALLSGTNYTAAYSGLSADLVNTYANSNSFTAAQSTLLQNVDRFHEAFLRPLAAAGNTRVWNLLIDVIAQTGRYPESATSPANFMVDGEQRYWVHVAIDRYTGQVLDKQVEVVKD